MSKIETVPMLPGPGVTECVRAEAAARDARQHADAETPIEALAALIDLQTCRRDLDAAELSLVRYCRSKGRTWEQIAAALGVTRGAASIRFRARGVQ